MRKANVKAKVIAILTAVMLVLLFAGLLCLPSVRQTKAAAANETVTNAAGLLTAYQSAAEDGSTTITLGGDITLDLINDTSITGALPNGHMEMPKGVTIDLGGHTLTVKTGDASGTAQGVAPCCINIGQGSAATVTIKNGTLTGESYGAFAYVQSGSALNLEDVTVNFTHNDGAETDYSAALVSAGTVKMDGVTFGTLTNSYPMENNGTLTGGVQDLINASSASEPATITLTEDLTQNLVVPAYASVTLDLGGHTITNVQKDNGYYDHAITNNGTLTIKGEGTVNATNGKNAIYNNTGATLTIENGTFSATGAQALFNKGTATISGGSFSCSNGQQLITAFSGSLTITSGDFYNSNTFGGTAVGVTGGEVTISGGTFSAYNQAFSISNGTVTISGGDYTVRSTATSAQIFSGSGNATVSGGTFNKAVSPEYLAEGAAFGYDAKTGTFTVQKDATVFAHVVRDGQTYEFAQPQEAINFAEEGETVVFDVSFRLNGALVVNKSIDLDLNGKTITNYDVNQTVIQVNSTTSDQITVEISSSQTGGSLVSEDGIAVWALRDANVTVDGLTLQGNSDAAYVGNSGENRTASLTLTNCTISAEYGVAVWGNTATGATPTAEPVKLVLDGCTVNAEVFGVYGNGAQHNTEIELKNSNITATTGLGVYHPQNGTLTVDGGSITGVESAIEIRAGSLTIKNNAVLTATATEFATNSNGNGTTVSGAALAISQHTTDYDINVTIESGTFHGVKAVYEADLQNTSSDNIDLTIENGTFEGAVESQNVANFIESGSFSEPVNTAYIAEGATMYVDANGQTKVGTGIETADAVAKIGENLYYADLQAAIDAAKEGDIVTLLKDVTTTAALSIESAITLDLNGLDITADGCRAIEVSAQGVTITSSQDNSVISTNYYRAINIGVTEQEDGAQPIKISNVTVRATSGSGTNTVGAIVVSGATVEIDKVTASGTAGAGGNSVQFAAAVVVLEYSNVTITNSSLSSSKGSGANVEAHTIHSGSDTNSRGIVVTVKNSQITSDDTGVMFLGIYNNVDAQNAVDADQGALPKLTLENTDVTASSFAVYGNGATHGTVIEIKGGTIKSENAQAIYHPQYGYLTISDAAVIEGVTGIEMRAGVLTISDASVQVTATGNFSETANPSGSTIGGAAVAISQHTTNLPISVELSAGTYSATGENGKAVYEADLQDTDSDNINLTIENGTYTGEVYSENVANFIEGGTFSEAVNKDYLAEGRMQLQQSASGTVTIVENEDAAVTAGAVAVVASTNAAYTDLQAAIEAAADGDTVTLLADITDPPLTPDPADDSVYYTHYHINHKSITIDGDGHTITSSTAPSRSDGVKDQTRIFYIVGKTKNYTDTETVFNVTLKDLTVKTTGAASRPLETRGGNIDLTLENVTLDNSESDIAMESPLTVNGNSEGAAHPVVITMTDSTLKTNRDGYAFRAFNPVELTMNGGALTGGRAALYMQRAINSIGTDGSVVTLTDVAIDGIADRPYVAGASEVFGLFVFEDNNVDVTVSGGTINVTKEANTFDYSVVFYNKVGVALSGINVNFKDDTKITLSSGVDFASIPSDGESPENCTEILHEGVTINIPVETRYFAAGDALLVGEDGYTVVDVETAVNNGTAEAAVTSDGTYILYATLQDAIDAAKNGDTVTLLKDVTGSFTVAEGQEITLDLNGKNISNSGNVHTLANYGVLTVQDTVGGGTVDNTASGRAAFINYGTATLNGGTFTRSVDKPGTTWYTIKNYGHLTINEGTTVSTLGTSTSSMIANGFQSSSDKTNNVGSINTNDKVPTLTITGGTFDSNYITIKNDEEGVLAISGGTFDKNGATTDQSVQNWHEATITGGEFNKPVISWEQGSIEGELTVEGGIFHDEVYAIELNASGDAGYIGEDGVVISGGTFDELVDKNYLAENVSLYTDEAGSYEVAASAPEGMVAVGVIVNGEGYANVASALAAVSGDITITLYTDLEEAVVIPADRTVTLDLAGYTLTAPSDVRHTVYNEGKLTIISTGEQGTIIGSTSAIFNGTNGEGESTPGALYGAVLSLDNVRLEATNTAAAVTLNNNYATIESITDCEIVTAAGTTAIANSGYIKSISGTTINAPEGSGLFGGAGTAIRLSGDKEIANSGTIEEMTNCTVTGNITTVTAEAVGQLKMTDCTFNGEMNFASGSSLYDYTAAEGTIYVGTQDHMVSSGAVAVIGTTAYGSLKDAITAAASNDTITLITDVTVDSTISIRTTKKLTFDLGGNTIKGGEVENIFEITTTTVTFDNGTIEAQNTAFELIGSSLMASATVTFGDDLTITSQNDSAVYIYGGYKLDTAADITARLAAIMGNGTKSGFTTINVTGGSLTSTDSVAMYLPQKFGTTNISGGTITGRTGIEIRNGTLNITGGTIVATGESLVTEPNGSGSTVNAGAAVAISKYTGTNTLKVTISDGELEGLYAIYEANLNPDGAEIDVTKITPSVTGGTFTGTVYSENLTGFISGGTFDKALTAKYLADGFMQTESDGLYTVVEGEAVVGEGAAAVNADTMITYDSLQEAIDAAEAGQTITLLNDVETTATITVAEGKELTLELGDKTLSAADGVEVTLENAGTLTITGGTIAGSTAIVNSGYITSIEGTVINAEGGTAIRLAGDAEVENSGTIAEVNGCTVTGDITTATAEAVGQIKMTGGSFSGEVNFAEGTQLYDYNTADARYIGLSDYVVSAGAVAAIGTTAYDGLQTAIDAAESDTVVLLTSVTANETITITDGYAVTLDLNGMSVTGGDLEQLFLVDGVHFSVFNGSVTAQNTAFELIGNAGEFGRSMTFGTGLTVISVNGTAISVSDSVILDIRADITAKGYAVAANEGETGSIEIRVNGGSLTSTDGTALYLAHSGAVTEIMDGTVTGKTGIELVSGTLNITGGTVTGQTGIELVGGTLNITDGTVTGQTGIELVGGTLNITGGTIAASDDAGYALYIAKAEEGAEAAAAITGGTFEGKVYAEELTGFITGGKFAVEPAAEACGENCEVRLGEDGYYTVINVTALNEAREAAQAEVAAYAAENGMSLEYIRGLAAEESGSALKDEAQALLDAYDAIAKAEDVSAVGTAKDAAIDAVDALLAAFGTLKEDAAAQIDGAAAQAGITAPEGLYTAVEAAATEEELAESLEAAFDEIAAIAGYLEDIGGQSEALESIAGALETLEEALSGTAEDAAITAAREAIARAEAAIAAGTAGEESSASLAEVYNELNSDREEALAALTQKAEEADEVLNAINDTLGAFGALDGTEGFDAMLEEVGRAVETIKAGDTASLAAAAEEIGGIAQQIEEALLAADGAVAAVNGEMTSAAGTLKASGLFGSTAEGLEAAVIATEGATIESLAEDLAAAQAAIQTAVGRLAGEDGELAAFQEQFTAIAASVTSLGGDAGALEEALQGVGTSLGAIESSESDLDKLSAAAQGAADANAVVAAVEAIFQGWTADGGLIGELEARLTAANDAIGSLREEAQETIGAAIAEAEAALEELRGNIAAFSGAEDAAAAAEDILQEIAALQTSVDEIESDVSAAETDSGSDLTWLYVVIAVVAVAAVAVVVVLLVRRKKTQANAEADDTKPADQADETKPADQADDTKPADQADDTKHDKE